MPYSANSGTVVSDAITTASAPAIAATGARLRAPPASVAQNINVSCRAISRRNLANGAGNACARRALAAGVGKFAQKRLMVFRARTKRLPGREIGIVITGLSPDGSGNIAVPAAILSQLGSNDANIFLSVGGLAAGSAFTGSVLAREPDMQPEGVFVMA